MKKGIITDSELNALSDVLANPDNYDKYGITTGLVFNKAKKILKYQGARTASNIEKFLRENGDFRNSRADSITVYCNVNWICVKQMQGSKCRGKCKTGEARY